MEEVFLILLVTYVLINCIFATLYIFQGTNFINGIEPSSSFNEFLSAFDFSVHTFTTLGYGHISPASTWANAVSIINAFGGLISFTLATGLLFAKFSMPSHEIIFSDVILMSPYADTEALKLRFVNSMDNNIVDLSARITMTWIIEEGDHYRRKFANLKLELDHFYMFPLN